MSSKIVFVKMSGTGNDFIFLNEDEPNFHERWKLRFASKTRSEVAQELCHRNLSVGADGMVFLHKISDHEITWDFYNADGTHPKMCGNAARCAAAYAKEILKTKSSLKLNTGAGPVGAEVGKNREVTVKMPKVQELQSSQSIIVGNKSYTYEICDTGVPHAVIQVDSIECKKSLKPVIDRLRFPPDFDKDGANVTFVESRQSYIKAVTFERGVEGFTLACGTGAVAARWSMRKHFQMKKDLKVQMPGGDLVVEMHEELPYWRATLSGRVSFVYTGTLI